MPLFQRKQKKEKKPEQSSRGTSSKSQGTKRKDEGKKKASKPKKPTQSARQARGKQAPSSAKTAAGRQGKQAQGKRSPKTERIAYRVIIRPQITEKAGRVANQNQYVFRVASRAGKQEIAQAIQELYGIKPVRVNTVSIPGKRRRLGKTEGTIPGYKKAYVTLPKGKTIELNV